MIHANARSNAVASRTIRANRLRRSGCAVHRCPADAAVSSPPGRLKSSVEPSGAALALSPAVLPDTPGWFHTQP